MSIIDNIIYYLIDKPKDIYLTIKHWFYCNWNKEHWTLVKYAITSYGYDYAYLYELIEAQIEKQVKWFSKHQRMVDEQYNQITKSLRWAKYCIHVINNDSDLYHFEGGRDFLEENCSVCKTVESLPTYVYDGPYVNIKNINRFINTDKKDIYCFWIEHKDILYTEKCKNLFWKIMQQYSELWWD